MPPIKIKRTENKENYNVVLSAGEPFYNLATKKLYIGNKDNDKITATRPHIAKISRAIPVTDSEGNPEDAGQVKIYVGEAADNYITLRGKDFLTVNPTDLLESPGKAVVKKSASLKYKRGDTNTPVYFNSEGIPQECEGLCKTVDTIESRHK